MEPTLSTSHIMKQIPNYLVFSLINSHQKLLINHQIVLNKWQIYSRTTCLSLTISVFVVEKWLVHGWHPDFQKKNYCMDRSNLSNK
jgi:hypothetical protein